jgi:hypothetical protein
MILSPSFPSCFSPVHHLLPFHNLGPLLIIGTTTNLVLGIVVIASDFFATALPDTAEMTTKRLTAVITRKGKVSINRKTVVAPFIGDAMIPAFGHTSPAKIQRTGTSLSRTAESGLGGSRTSMEQLQTLVQGCGDDIMTDVVEALVDDARERHQIVYGPDDLMEMLPFGKESAEDVVEAVLEDLQERLDIMSYDERDLAEIVAKAKSLQHNRRLAITTPQTLNPSSVDDADAAVRRSSKIETTRRGSGTEAVVVKNRARKARRSTAKRAEL